jgi:hypothetical protein
MKKLLKIAKLRNYPFEVKVKILISRELKKEVIWAKTSLGSLEISKYLELLTLILDNICLICN